MLSRSCAAPGRLTRPPAPACRRYYERFFGELPSDQRAAARKAHLEDKVRQLIMRKERDARAKPAPVVKPSGSGGAGAAARPPARMVTAVSTMPGGHKPWITAPARPADSSGGAALTRRHSDENEQPGSRRYAAAQQLQQVPAPSQEDGKLWRPQEAPRPSASMQASQGRSTASRGLASGLSAMPPSGAVLMRQIELKAALRPPSAEPPHKSPWRPPGGQGGCIRALPVGAAAWWPFAGSHI